MEKIVTHPLYMRCKKVIESCKSRKQFETATTYSRFAYDRMQKEYKSNNFMDTIDYQWDVMRFLNELLTSSKYYGGFDDI